MSSSAKNSTVKHFIVIDSQCLPLTDACAKFKVSYPCVIKYMRRRKITAQQAFDHYYHSATVTPNPKKLPVYPYIPFGKGE